MGEYDPAAFEEAIQSRWSASGLFDALRPSASQDAFGTRRPKTAYSYVFVAPPFPTGALHMGHVRSYTLADTYARYRRARGDAVLFSIGFDSFGLPAELAAIQRNEPTADWVAHCCRQMRAELRRLGISFDWSREYDTSDPDVFQWTQWLFLHLVRERLVYQATGWTDWCDTCDTALASMQVDDGRCWRCHGPVRVVDIEQWYLDVTSYAKENEERLGEERTPAEPDWVASQRTILGRVDGYDLHARSASGRPLRVFQPAGHREGNPCCVLMSPRHADISLWMQDSAARNAIEELRKGGWGRASRDVSSVSLMDLGLHVRIEGVDGTLPLIVTPSVDSRYGETAVLCTPNVDSTDAVLARRLGDTVVERDVNLERLRCSSTPSVRYRVRDFVISRQRDWGAPIPIVHCPACGVVPVPESQLPILNEERGKSAPCPECGNLARRETDTLDCHFDGLWWWMANCVPATERRESLFTHPELERWLPGHCLIWGIDGSGYVFDQRVVTKAMRDSGVWPWMTNGEPFERALLHEMVRFEGRKMSKHLGNVVEPATLMDSFGADALRLAVVRAASPRNTFTWTDTGLKGSYEALRTLWRYARPRLPHDVPAERSRAPSDRLRGQLRRWCAAATRRVDADMESLSFHRASHNAFELLDRIETFERRVLEKRDLDEHDREAIAIALRLLLELLAPFVPHVCDELWQSAGDNGLATTQPWPSETRRTSPAAAA